MASVTVKSTAGVTVSDLELADHVFGIQPNVPVMHQVVTAQLAARRAGTQSTKTPVTLVRAPPVHRTSAAVAWPSGPSRVSTARRPRRR